MTATLFGTGEGPLLGLKSNSLVYTCLLIDTSTGLPSTRRPKTARNAAPAAAACAGVCFLERVSQDSVVGNGYAG